MNLFKKKMSEVEAIDRELERLYEILGSGSKEINGEIYQRIREFQKTLIEITRKMNGLEY